MTLGAVVVAYQDPESLDRCLQSLEALDHVVVSNVTADRRVSSVVEARGRVDLPITANVGYAAAVNAGARVLPADVDEVLFANDDVTLCSAVSPRIDQVRVLRQRSPSGDPLPLLHHLPTPLGFIRGWVLGRPVDSPGAGAEVPDHAAANGAAVRLPREVIQSHPLPEEYFLYWEETAWMWRLRDAGVRIMIDEAWVERPDGRGERSSVKARLMGENLIRLAAERYGRRAAPLYLCLGVAWVLRLFVTDMFHHDRLERWRSRWQTLRGLLHGPLQTGRVHAHD